jgi:hypothetical protein
MNVSIEQIRSPFLSEDEQESCSPNKRKQIEPSGMSLSRLMRAINNGDVSLTKRLRRKI